MLDLTRLQVLRAVVAAGSINAAAQNLGYTASAVSQQVSALQRETGLVLFTRAGRGIQPTAAGQQVAALADELLGHADAMEQRLAALRQGRSGQLSLAYFSSAALAWIPVVVRGLRAAHPDLELSLQQRELPSLSPDERVDVEVVVERAGFQPATGLRAVELLREPYLALLPPGHRLAGATQLAMAELRDEGWISHDREPSWCLRAVNQACAAAGFAPSYAVATDDHLTALQFVAAGVGVAVMPRLCLAELPDGVSAVPLVNPTPERVVHAVVHEGSLASPPVRLALELLQRCGRDEAARWQQVTSPGRPALR